MQGCSPASKLQEQGGLGLSLHRTARMHAEHPMATTAMHTPYVAANQLRVRVFICFDASTAWLQGAALVSAAVLLTWRRWHARSISRFDEIRPRQSALEVSEGTQGYGGSNDDLQACGLTPTAESSTN